MHTYIHTHIHAHAYTHLHAYIHTRACIHTHTYTHTHTVAWCFDYCYCFCLVSELETRKRTNKTTLWRIVYARSSSEPPGAETSNTTAAHTSFQNVFFSHTPWAGKWLHKAIRAQVLIPSAPLSSLCPFHLRFMTWGKTSGTNTASQTGGRRNREKPKLPCQFQSS